MPVSYDLSVAPQLRTMHTDGTETIRVVVASPVDHIVLNSVGIAVSNVTIDASPASVETHNKLEQVWLRSGTAIQPGKHEIQLSFVSRINSTIEASGFWNDRAFDGKTRASLLVSMFEPSTARTMFPCFDEPAFRATFTLHVTAPAAWTVVSNMPATTRTPLADEMVRTDFAPTPPMPTYLLTVDMGVMTSVAGESDGVPIHVYAAPGTPGLDLILSRAKSILHYYQSYLGVPYALPKLDIIAAPGDFHSALEQWGAMTFYDVQDITTGSNDDAATGQRRAFDEVAHEMGHQWFGDLVGMQWWRDAFVAEGITEWIAYAADKALEPDLAWFRDEDNGADSVMALGTRKKSMPVVSTIVTDFNNDDQVAFSLATYDKGAAVLEMWRAYIGENAFRASLHRYLTQNSGRAVPFEQFWNAFDDPAATRYGAAWLKRPGYPIVAVAFRCDGSRQSAFLSQTPFVTALGSPPGYTSFIWPAPVTLAVANNAPRAYLLQSKQMQVPAGACGQRVAVDRGMRPYYRVRYADVLRAAKMLRAASEQDRSNAIRDAIALQRAGFVPADYFLTLAQLIHSGYDPYMIRQSAFLYAELYAALPPGAERDAVARLARRQLGPMIKTVPPASSNAQPQPYTVALSVLAELGYPEFSSQAQHRLEQTSDKGSRSFMRELLAEIAASGADAAHVNAMETQLKKTSTSGSAFGRGADSEAFAYLTNVGSPALARRVFLDNLSDPTVFFTLARRYPGIAWNLLQTHQRSLLLHIPPSQQAPFLSDLVAQTFWFLPAKELRAYLQRNFGPYSPRSIHVAMQLVADRQKAAATLTAQVRRYMRAR